MAINVFKLALDGSDHPRAPPHRMKLGIVAVTALAALVSANGDFDLDNITDLNQLLSSGSGGGSSGQGLWGSVQPLIQQATPLVQQTAPLLTQPLSGGNVGNMGALGSLYQLSSGSGSRNPGTQVGLDLAKAGAGVAGNLLTSFSGKSGSPGQQPKMASAGAGAGIPAAGWASPYMMQSGLSGAGAGAAAAPKFDADGNPLPSGGPNVIINVPPVDPKLLAGRSKKKNSLAGQLKPQVLLHNLARAFGNRFDQIKQKIDTLHNLSINAQLQARQEKMRQEQKRQSETRLHQLANAIGGILKKKRRPALQAAIPVVTQPQMVMGAPISASQPMTAPQAVVAPQPMMAPQAVVAPQQVMAPQPALNPTIVPIAVPAHSFGHVAAAPPAAAPATIVPIASAAAPVSASAVPLTMVAPAASGSPVAGSGQVFAGVPSSAYLGSLGAFPTHGIAASGQAAPGMATAPASSLWTMGHLGPLSPSGSSWSGPQEVATSDDI